MFVLPYELFIVLTFVSAFGAIAWMVIFGFKYDKDWTVVILPIILLFGIAVFSMRVGLEEQNLDYENKLITQYQSLKPSLDMKSCPELEKIITFSTNQTMIDFAKRNYNERCL